MGEVCENELVTTHLSLVGAVVGRECKKLGTDAATNEEMRSFAMEGLVLAAKRYDSKRGIPFRAYAELKMRWAIYDGLAQLGWFPRRLRRNINFYRRANEILRCHADTPPPKDKVEAVHRLSDRLKDLATAYVTSYSAEAEKEPASHPPEAEETLERKRFKRRIRTYIDTLPSKERQVVWDYFFEDANLSDIAAKLEVTTSWASRLLSSGLKKLRIILDNQTELVDSVRRSGP